MKITKNTVVTVKYQLLDAQNNLIEDGLEPIVYLHGGYDTVLPAIEKALEGKEKGYSTMIQVEPYDAFGDYDPELIQIEDRSKFPETLEVGMQFEGIPDDDENDAVIYTVTDIAEDKVVLDGNHPLAGIALRFALDVLEVRAATEDEIAQENAHGAADHGFHVGHSDLMGIGGCGCGHDHGGCGCGGHHHHACSCAEDDEDDCDCAHGHAHVCGCGGHHSFHMGDDDDDDPGFHVSDDEDDEGKHYRSIILH